jgi:1-acyl-sn-glycerol-3-phosphate acyltransferase
MIEPAGRRLAKALLGTYMRAWHRLRLEGMELLPARGPALVLTNHASLLDIPALMAADPYPDTVFVVKASVFRVAPLRPLLRAWGAIPVERTGRDLRGIRAILAALRAGRVVALAPEGRRSRTGRLGPINPVLARIAARAGVPLVPVGIRGSFAALPPGARRPRRRPIAVRVGPPLALDGGDPAAAIRRAIAELLPADQRPCATAAEGAGAPLPGATEGVHHSGPEEQPT